LARDLLKRVVIRSIGSALKRYAGRRSGPRGWYHRSGLRPGTS